MIFVFSRKLLWLADDKGRAKTMNAPANKYASAEVHGDFLSRLCEPEARSRLEHIFQMMGWHVASVDAGDTDVGQEFTRNILSWPAVHSSTKTFHVEIKVGRAEVDLSGIRSRVAAGERVLLISEWTASEIANALRALMPRITQTWLYVVCRLGASAFEVLRIDPDGESPVCVAHTATRGTLPRDFSNLLLARRLMRRGKSRTEDYGRSASSRWIAAQNKGFVEEVAVRDIAPMVKAFQPVAPRGNPILYIHGGGLVHYDLDVFTPFLSYFARVLGATIIALGYEKCPETPADQVIDRLMERVVDLSREIDVRRMIGDSIGGLLSLYAALRVVPGRFQEVTLIYPVLSMRQTYPSFERYGEGFLLDAEDMRWFRSLVSPRFRAEGFDPLEFTAEAIDGMRITVVSAGCDVLADEAHAFSSKTAAKLLHFADLPHDFCLYHGSISSARGAIETIAEKLVSQERNVS